MALPTEAPAAPETPAAPEVGSPPPAAGGAEGGAVERPATLRDVAEAEATKQGIDPRLVHAVIQTESSYNPAAHNPSGAHGLMQLMPATAARWKVDANDPVQNIRGGVSELKQLLDQNGGDVVKALRLYNGSPQASEAATQPYVDKVLGQLKPRTAGAPAAAPNGGQIAAGATPAPTSTPTPGAPPPAPPESWGQWAVRQGKNVLEQFDPRQQTGRQNIAGMVGGGIGGGMSGGLGAVAGATAGGALESEGEDLYKQLTGQAPPSTGSAAEAAGMGGLVQGGQEAVGQGLMWPVKAVGRRIIGSRVGRFAEEGLSAAKTAALTKLQGALDTAQDFLRTTKAGARTANVQAGTTTRQLVTNAANTARKGVEQATSDVADRTGVAKDLAEHGVEQAQKAAETGEAGASSRYNQIVGSKPPSAAAAGRAANEVIQTGGAAEARNMAGRAVDAAAESGPDIDISQLKAEARKVVEGQIRPPETSFPRRAPADVAAEGVDAEHAALAASTGMSKEDISKMAERAANEPDSAAAKAYAVIKKSAGEYLSETPAASLSPAEQALAEAQGEAGKESLKHPAMSVLQRILNAGDTVPFKDAHLWKVELDNAIRNTRDQSVKSQVAALTQKFTGSLRGALKAAGHQPYEDATAAYAKIAPLYTKGYAASLKKVAREAPESIVTMLNPAQPTKAKMLVDLLTHQAAEGGDAEGGRAALESVQAAWVRKKVIEGGIEKLGDRVDKIPAEFRSAFLGDRKAKSVLDNLKLIHTAYQTAVATGERGVQAAKESGKAGLEAAGALGEQQIGQAREAGRKVVQAARVTREGIIGQTKATGEAAVEKAASAVGPARKALRQGVQYHRGQEQALRQSSLGATITPEAGLRTGADLLRTAAMASTGVGGIAHSYYGTLSLLRLLKGPTAQDLVQWASHSPAGTRMFVKAITSNAPAAALSNLTRASGILGDVGAPQPGHTGQRQTGPRPPLGIKKGPAQSTPGQPPPPPQQVGAPPPPT